MTSKVSLPRKTAHDVAQAAKTAGPAGSYRSTVSPFIDRSSARGLGLRAAAALEGGASLMPRVQAFESDSFDGRIFSVIPMELLYVHKNNARPVGGGDVESLTEFADEIALNGLQDPIHVFQAEDGRYAIQDGQRRFLAYRKLARKEIPCLVHERPKSAFDVYTFGCALHESRLKPSAIDQATAWKRLIDSGDATQEVISRFHQISQSSVSRKMSILKAPLVLQEVVLQRPYHFGERVLELLFHIARLDLDAAMGAAKLIAINPIVGEDEDDGEEDASVRREKKSGAIAPSVRDLILLRKRLEARAQIDGASAGGEEKPKEPARSREVKIAMGTWKIRPDGKITFSPAAGVSIPVALLEEVVAEVARRMDAGLNP